MLFPTTDFAIFFAVAFTANWLLNPFPRLWKLVMMAASFVFYSWWDWRFVFLLAAVDGHRAGRGSGGAAVRGTSAPGGSP